MSQTHKILVADDSETVTTLLRAGLEQGGFAVEVAHNGMETYERGRSGEFDLVILDQLMPGLLGLEIIDKWRAEGVDTKVIMLTAVDDEKTVVDSLDKGAVDYVRKPFQLPEILARVRHRLAD